MTDKPEKSTKIPIRSIRLIIGIFMAIILITVGVVNLINPDVPIGFMDKNTHVCSMLILTGAITIYALFRPFSGGLLICLCTAGLGYVFGGYLQNPTTPVVLLLGLFFIVSAYFTRKKPEKNTENAPVQPDVS
jgi:uncharacterized membrane protein HdeD (DUF308 family)